MSFRLRQRQAVDLRVVDVVNATLHTDNDMMYLSLDVDTAHSAVMVEFTDVTAQTIEVRTARVTC